LEECWGYCARVRRVVASNTNLCYPKKKASALTAKKSWKMHALTARKPQCRLNTTKLETFKTPKFPPTPTSNKKHSNILQRFPSNLLPLPIKDHKIHFHKLTLAEKLPHPIRPPPPPKRPRHRRRIQYQLHPSIAIHLDIGINAFVWLVVQDICTDVCEKFVCAGGRNGRAVCGDFDGADFEE